MKRLGFVLPDFTRIQWASSEIRQVWEPRLGRARSAWVTVERRSVEYGLRPAASMIVKSDEVLAYESYAMTAGLEFARLAHLGPDSSTHVARSAAPRDAISIRVALARPGHVAELSRAWQTQDTLEVGRLLGYPACCARFFQRFWEHERLLDPVWRMGGDFLSHFGTHFEHNVVSHTNILLRALGIRLVSHLPCSWRCKDSLLLGIAYERLGATLGLGAEMGWLSQLLSLPSEWSALHGIALVKTPYFTLSYPTDSTAMKHTLRTLGPIPQDAAIGTTFPNASRHEDSEHRLNGFPSARGMDRAHRRILAYVGQLRKGRRGRLLDLGCGTGRLLISLARETGADIEGVDIDPTKVALARRLAPFGRYHCAAIDDWARSCQGSYDLALISLERFEESRNSFALSVALNKLAERVIVYSYSNRDLLTCATRAGVRLERVDGNAGQLVRSTARSLPVIQRSDG